MGAQVRLGAQPFFFWGGGRANCPFVLLPWCVKLTHKLFFLLILINGFGYSNDMINSDNRTLGEHFFWYITVGTMLGKVGVILKSGCGRQYFPHNLSTRL